MYKFFKRLRRYCFARWRCVFTVDSAICNFSVIPDVHVLQVAHFENPPAFGRQFFNGSKNFLEYLRFDLVAEIGGFFIFGSVQTLF